MQLKADCMELTPEIIIEMSKDKYIERNKNDNNPKLVF